ncbi:MAG: YeeE/YedE family protein [Bacteroidales bacterium]|nr:YeeE/YedE family protein [Bacteroidales bacterium]
MGPLFTAADEWSYVIALVLGIAFGYILESAGFSSSRKLAGVFYGYDFVVLRVFFTAAITAAIGLFYFDYLGWLNFSEIYVNKLYVGSAIVGGMIMGLGFIIGGFCPGTSACAAAIGKVDAMIFIGGVVIGAIIFDAGYPLWGEFYESGGKGSATLYEDLGISRELLLFGFILFALFAFWATALIQKKVSNKTHKY